MATTLAQMKTKVWQILNKSSSQAGFYTADKVTFAINDSLDYVASRMMMEGEGWQQVIGYLTTVANTATVALPAAASIINAVRYLKGTVYEKLDYDDQAEENQISTTSSQPYPTTYRLVGANIYFNPIPQVVGTDYVQIEYTSYPSDLSLDADNVNSQFDKALLNYVAWSSASKCAAMVGKSFPDWTHYEQLWYKQMEEIISKRNRVNTHVGEFRY